MATTEELAHDIGHGFGVLGASISFLLHGADEDADMRFKHTVTLPFLNKMRDTITPDELKAACIKGLRAVLSELEAHP